MCFFSPFMLDILSIRVTYAMFKTLTNGKDERKFTVRTRVQNYRICVFTVKLT